MLPYNEIYSGRSGFWVVVVDPAVVVVDPAVVVVDWMVVVVDPAVVVVDWVVVVVDWAVVVIMSFSDVSDASEETVVVLSLIHI